MRGAVVNFTVRETATLRSRIFSNFVQSIEEESQALKPTRVLFPYPEEGHTKNVLRVFCSLQKQIYLRINTLSGYRGQPQEKEG